jgi:hypothetical protein
MVNGVSPVWMMSARVDPHPASPKSVIKDLNEHPHSSFRIWGRCPKDGGGLVDDVGYRFRVGHGGFLLWFLFYPHPASPKYDEIKSVCGFKICIVGFGGGVRRTEGVSLTM